MLARSCCKHPGGDTVSKRAAIVLLIACVCALVAGGCRVSPGAKALLKSQKRQTKQLQTEGRDVAPGAAGTATTSTSSTTSTTAAAPASLTAAQMSQERSVFSNTCGGCHTLADAKTTGAVGPVLDTLQPRPDEARIVQQIENPAPPMTPGLLQGNDVTLMAEYVSQAIGGSASGSESGSAAAGASSASSTTSTSATASTATTGSATSTTTK
jgi:mono/diheme cytochrome c family protein